MTYLSSSIVCTFMTAVALFSSTASAVPIFSFLVDGDTAFTPFSISNLSDAGEMVTKFHLDISATNTCFDVTNSKVDSCPGNFANGATALAAQGGSDILTGLLPSSVNDGDTILDFLFTDFNAGESLVWDLDVDGLGAGSNGTILGNQLIGATAFVEFSNGERLSGSLEAVGNNADASAFYVAGVESITPPGISTTAEVPVPSTFWLMVCALVGFPLRNLSARRREQIGLRLDLRRAV